MRARQACIELELEFVPIRTKGRRAAQAVFRPALLELTPKQLGVVAAAWHVANREGKRERREAFELRGNELDQRLRRALTCELITRAVFGRHLFERRQIGRALAALLQRALALLQSALV